MKNSEVLNGALIVSTVYGVCALLSALIPGHIVTGYVLGRDGKPLKYKLNGMIVLLSMMWLWLMLGLYEVVPFEFIAENFWGSAITACVLGLVGSMYFYLRGSALPPDQVESYIRCPTRDRPKRNPSKADIDAFESRSFAAHFFLGLEFNPRWGDLFDVKMFLYLVGAAMLMLNILSATALQIKNGGTGNISVAMATYLWCFSHFILEYVHFEQPHLYTYDIFAERIGLKLFWGCCFFYPFFYCIGAWALTVPKGHDITYSQAFAIVSLFYTGWVFTRGANMQKYWFKRNPSSTHAWFGLIRQETIPGSTLLCSGFWSLSKHVNFMGEIIQALALSLPGLLYSGGSNWAPLLYPLYYVALFVPRQIDDEAICAAKYGKKWEEYSRRVKYRIVPGIY